MVKTYQSYNKQNNLSKKYNSRHMTGKRIPNF